MSKGSSPLGQANTATADQLFPRQLIFKPFTIYYFFALTFFFNNCHGTTLRAVP